MRGSRFSVQWLHLELGADTIAGGKRGVLQSFAGVALHLADLGRHPGSSFKELAAHFAATLLWSTRLRAWRFDLGCRVEHGTELLR